MEIEVLRKLRLELEEDLARMISDRVSRFTEEAGCCPHKIDVQMIEATCVGDKEPRYAVGRVSAEIQL